MPSHIARRSAPIYIDRNHADLLPREKRTLIVLFIPSVERDGLTPVEQNRWVNTALDVFGKVYGGATAYPRAKGVWRDDERDGALVFDEPVVVHCYTTPRDAQSRSKLKKLVSFCRRLGRETHQGEVGFVIDDRYYALRDFKEERR